MHISWNSWKSMWFGPNSWWRSSNPWIIRSYTWRRTARHLIVWSTKWLFLVLRRWRSASHWSRTCRCIKSICRSLNNGLLSRNSWSELHSNCHSSHTLIHFCITFAFLISVLHFISVQICFTSEPIIFQNFYSKSNFNYNFVQKILIVVKLLKIKFQQLLLL
jgi:hypothetical protein